MLGITLFEKGTSQEAVYQLSKAVELDPKNPLLRRQLEQVQKTASTPKQPLSGPSE